MTTELYPACKTCCSCKEEKALEAFSRQHNGKFGRQHFCKLCMSKYQAYYRVNTPDAIERSREYTREFRTTPKGMFASLRGGAKKRGLTFDLTLEDVIQFFWRKACHYCGEVNDTSGIDRVDNTVGYTPENSVPCCKVCNLMKYRYTAEDFLRKCHQIAQRTQ